MGDLKKGWKRVKFGEVVRHVKDKVDPTTAGLERYIAGEHMDTDDLRIRRWGDVGDGYLGPAFHMRFKAGQVLYGSRRTYLRKVALADFDGITANTTFVMESADPNVLLPELLPFIMQTEPFHEHSKRESKGSVNPYVNFSDLAWYEFALPPLEEQRRMVEVLEAANACNVRWFDAQRIAVSTLSSAVEQLFLPVSKNLRPLGEVSDIQYGLTVNKDRRKMESETPYLRVANVQRGSLELSEIKTIGRQKGDERFVLLEGDVLVVEGHADPTEVGRCAIWTKRSGEWLHQNHLIRVRAVSETAVPEFILEYINSTFGRNYLRRHAKSTSGLSTLNSTVIREMPIPSCPLIVQKEIIQQIAEFRNMLAQIEQRAQQSRTNSSLLLKSLWGNA